MSSSVIIPIEFDGEVKVGGKNGRHGLRPCLSRFASMLAAMEISSKDEGTKKVIHSVKVGVALTLVSLLYVIDSLYHRVGDNAMWAIMTVVVIFEFHAGAVLSKGLNRGIGTVIGGGLGCLVAVLARKVDGVGNEIIICTSVFISGAGATYVRLIPTIKKKYDYGAMIFILTFNLVVVSCLRADNIIRITSERFSTIFMGFGICLFTCLVFLPNWSSDELHVSVAARFEGLARALGECYEGYLDAASPKENKPAVALSGTCKTILQSKSKDESLAVFAKWEPWHGNFGLSYPWKKYLQIGELLRELAAIVISLKLCLESPGQMIIGDVKGSIDDTLEVSTTCLMWALRELGGSISKMTRCQPEETILPRLKSTGQELSQTVSQAISPCRELRNGNEIMFSSSLVLLMAMAKKVEELAKEVKELGEEAGFNTP
ncbi:hypothetical protein MLD38_040002 [Melastoma candidum]|uniref:Uncharacterized protein n=1 Tax=Melastoma candidum TaxID=119954 RepID=A0ACB9L4T2_9MYRT|nr:hypothetical protein MLD38_040002 [Melastoma candidum]